MTPEDDQIPQRNFLQPVDSRSNTRQPVDANTRDLSMEIRALLDTYAAWGVTEFLADQPQGLHVVTATPEAPTRQTSAQRSETVTTDTPVRVELPPSAPHSAAVRHPALEGLARTAMREVGPTVPPKARFLIVGEAPDADEDRSGRAFSGQARDILDKMLASIALKSEEIAFAPAVPWRPPGGRPLSPAEISPSRACLHLEIQKIAPHFIVTMGALPLKLLLGDVTTLNSVRGAWQKTRIHDIMFDVLPMRHPLQILTSSRARQDFWQDLLTLSQKL